MNEAASFERFGALKSDSDVQSASSQFGSKPRHQALGGASMRLNDLDLNQLIVLDALLTEKNVSAAAQRVCLSQSGASTALKRLRDCFHDPLLVAVGRNMVLTPLAVELVNPIHNVLLQIQAITSNRSAFDPASSNREISIVVSDYAGTIFMPEVLRRAAEQAPNIRIYMRPVEDKWREKLEPGKVDFALVADAIALHNYPTETIFQDKMCCVAWSKNRAASDGMSLDQYLKMGHVALQFSAGWPSTVEDTALRKAGYRRNIEVLAPTFNLLPSLVIGTRRIATIPSRLAKIYARRFPLKVIEIPIEIPSLVEVLQYHEYQKYDPACVWFRNLLMAVGRDLPIQ